MRQIWAGVWDGHAIFDTEPNIEMRVERSDYSDRILIVEYVPVKLRSFEFGEDITYEEAQKRVRAVLEPRYEPPDPGLISTAEIAAGHPIEPEEQEPSIVSMGLHEIEDSLVIWDPEEQERLPAPARPFGHFPLANWDD